MNLSVRKRHTQMAVFLGFFLFLVSSSQAGMMPDPMETISYQGRLQANGQPFNGNVLMTFSLWDQQTGGSQIGSGWSASVNVIDGLFMTDLYFDFPQWSQPQYLQIVVDGVTLNTRQRIAPTPVAMFALDGIGGGDDSPWTVSGSNIHFNSGNVGIGTSSTPERLNVLGNIALTGWLGHSLPAGTPLPIVVSDQTAMRYRSGAESPNILGGIFENQINAGASGSVIAGGGRAGSLNNVSGNFSSIGGGRGNLLTGELGVIGGGLENVIQNGSTQSVIGGGFSNFVNADWGTVSGGRSNAVFSDYGTVAGGNVNIIFADSQNSFVGGGENNWIQPQGPAFARHSVITGGESNRVQSGLSFIGAGEDNVASGIRTFIGAGTGNQAQSGNAAVVGGSGNVASSTNSFVGGGSSNQATGSQSAVVGGSENVAQGQRSFAGGRRAQALHNGAFVWADGTTTVVQSTATNQFTAQASGGVRFFTNAALTTGVQVAANGGSWSSLSDRDAKRDFAQVDGRAVLERLIELPVMTWRYLGQDESTLHMGPVAQDFHAAFGLGGDELRIATIDADGVALAAIQGLYQALSERDLRIEALEAELTGLREQTFERIAVLESLLFEFQQLAMEAGR